MHFAAGEVEHEPGELWAEGEVLRGEKDGEGTGECDLGWR